MVLCVVGSIGTQKKKKHLGPIIKHWQCIGEAMLANLLLDSLDNITIFI